MTKPQAALEERREIANETERPTCGLVMPISSIDGCSEAHWKDVLEIISSAIRNAGFDPNLVSNDTDIGVIHKRIVQNLYNNPIVVCDVSGKNPNVMFELGMRLAFDKPVIIVKDDKTPYSFDTSPVEHLTYPRDLRFSSILDFQARLTEKLKHPQTPQNSFLSSFGTFKVAELKEESVGAMEIILEEISSIKQDLRQQRDHWTMDRRRMIERMSNENKARHFRDPIERIRMVLKAKGPLTAQNKLQSLLKLSPETKVLEMQKVSPEAIHYFLGISDKFSADYLRFRLSREVEELELSWDELA